MKDNTQPITHQRPPRPTLSVIHSTHKVNSRSSRSQILPSCRTLSDSQSSDGSCLDKKYYKCACRNGCSHKYQNYLADLREERKRKKQKMIEFFSAQTPKEDDLLLSSDSLFGEQMVKTPPKASLGRIAELTQSAECSGKKKEYSLKVSIGEQHFYGEWREKEGMQKCLEVLSELIQGDFK